MRKSLKTSTPAAAPPSQQTRYVCVHGHFYQPPRENPWLESVEVQDSAAPFHDWNDRITAECYAPNGASRITNAEDKIVRILNNYSRISFNFGPTLLSWLADKAPRAYRMILDADRASAQRFSGHGSALAQVYNHIIMPLASTRDARTQIRWGIADFEHRFGRKPEGMWLAETAVNRHTLDLLAQEGILYTILAPNQCARIRPMQPSTSVQAETTPVQAEPWTETMDATVDPTQPYRVNLDEGRSIAVFFYDGPNSRAIAFEGLLDSGEKFGERLLSGFRANPLGDSRRPQLSHVATDGESYGHHHKHGEMALSFALHWLEDKGHATLTNYGEFLDKFPPTWEAEVAEDTSWSCAHGVERWRSDCGCNGGKPGWNQQWRGPLRKALDLLRDETAPLAEQLAKPLLKDLWAARDAYIQVVLHRDDPDQSVEATETFLNQQALRPLTPAERTTVFELMELERHTQLMYTSCGWFFDEISGIETVQIIAYAGRVLQLAQELFGELDEFGKPRINGPAGSTLESRFLAILSGAQSNVADIGDGAQVYRRYVTGMRIGLEQVGAHYAISSIFRNYPEEGQIFCFDVHRDSHEVFTSGRGKVALGRARLRSRITEEVEEICFAVLHLGDQNLSAAIRRYTAADAASFDSFSADVRSALRKANLPEIIRLIDRYFAPAYDRRASPPVPHVVLDPVNPQPGQPESVMGAVEPGIAHTVDPIQAPQAPAKPLLPIAYSLTSLFADEQHRILQTILNQTLGEMEDSLRKIYEDHASLLHFLTDAGMTPPPALALAAHFATNSSLRHALEAEPFDAQEVADLLLRAATDHVPLDTQQLSFTAGASMKKAMVRLEAAFEAGPLSALAALNSALTLADLIHFMPFEVSIWQAQNIWNDLLRRTDLSYRTPEFRDGYKKLGQAMNIAVDELVVEDDVPAF
jgi:alpha-amylase/alpha-mannosidase (GH57 family)